MADFINSIDTEYLIGMARSIVYALGIILVINIGNRFLGLLIDQAFKDRLNINDKLGFENRRVDTLNSLTKSIVRYGLYFIGIITILDLFGVPVASLLAGAGIAGLAIGFGAQNLVRDVISGFFIIMEDQYAISEYVRINGNFGKIEDIGLRTTKIRAWTGELYTIPNGLIEEVTNYGRGSMRAVVEIGIAYEEDIENAVGVIEKACSLVYDEMEEYIDEKPYVMGVTALADSSVNIKVTGTTRGMNHWPLERKLRQRIKEEFDRSGVEIPYPRTVFINGGELDSEGGKTDGV